MDFGANSGRGILGTFDGYKLSIEEIHRFSNDPVRLPDGLHWDVLRLFHEIKQAILKCSSRTDRNIEAIGVDTWGVDFGLLSSSGELLGNPYHYRDERTQGMINEAGKRIDRLKLYSITGNQFQPFNTIYQLLSMVINRSPILEKAKTMLLLPDLFNYFLTGEKASEFTIVTTTQLYDVHASDWAWNIIDAMCIPRHIFTEIKPAGQIRGKLIPSLASELFIKEIPVVSVASHDTGSAVAAVPYSKKNAAFLSSGTWSLIGVEVEKPVISPKALEYNLTNEGCAGGTFRLLKNIAGLWIFQECKRFWDKQGPVQSYDELEEKAKSAQPFKAFIDPDDPMFYSPGNMPEKIVQYCKLTGQNAPQNKGEIVRCILESLALKYRLAIEQLEEVSGIRLETIHVVGGGTKDAMLCQYTANATQRQVIAGPVEATAIGNLLVQAMALGHINSINEAREVVKNSFATQEYTPQDATQWNEAYDRYVQFLKKKSKK
ncbi:rhamnulokinase [Caldanaerobius polysaccharolyticus]|uniref:rhamnulokinase n=1 Tax=Caldanaerobius polysaccharolyticus TaxID=44256 RepID=UPI0024814743|nr:rhamnulokinase family protein [Caldanaerobius polysaccharolyticus]